MTRKSIKEIIDSYSKHDFTPEVRSVFERWLADESDAEDKTNSMRELWDSMDAAPVPSMTEDPLEMLCADRPDRKLRRRTVLMWLSVAASVCIAVVSSVLAGSALRSEKVCLIASDMSKACFTLPDSSIIWLNKGSRLYYDKRFNSKKREVTLEGEGYFEVSKNREKPFIVKTPEMDIRVLGTRFTVSAYAGEAVSAYLVEGSIGISSEDMCDDIILKPDQMFRKSKDGGCRLSDVKASNHAAWIGDRMVFTDESLGNIAECMEHWFNVEIILDSHAADELLTMTIKGESADEIFTLIENLADIRYQWKDSDTIIVESF